ncbi:MAG: GNAT family N-acetyltransferase [Patescibacteria group bacterium]|nr:GNAT family N-acetyltransferase [Patescibacteria group bacterium]MBU1876773.1 GNAT family N-acetyltransferase [Patescibacteria group bacterium]
MTIRKAEPKDKKDILEITNLLYLDIPNFVWNTDEFIDRQIKNGEYFLAETEEKIVGIISFRQRKKKIHIETLSATDDHQSEGVGSQLIGFAKEFTKEKGFSILRVYSFHEYKTIDFYLKQGFSLLEKPGIYNNHEYYRLEMRI